jgi:anti-sigma regulatory factor (Ser/Thr protein kinase)
MTVVQLQNLFVAPTASSFRTETWMAELPQATNVVLDLAETPTQVASANRLRLDSVRVCLLANLLSTLRPDATIDLLLPTTNSLQVQLARTPLLSVLAGHPGTGHIPELGPWREVWDPHDRVQRTRLLEVSSNAIGPFQPYLLTLASPHRRSAPHLQRDVRGIVDPWLGRRFVARGLSEERNAAMRDLETAMSELIENVGDHADVESTGRQPCSIAQLMTTAGGGQASSDRFRLMVMDNGIGLPRSIKRRRGDLNGVTAVENALNGRLKYGARGRGLSHVRSVVERHPGSFFIMFTEFLPERNRSILATVDGSGEVVVRELGLPIAGTLAIGQIALPALADVNPTLFEVEDVELATVTA